MSDRGGSTNSDKPTFGKVITQVAPPPVSSSRIVSMTDRFTFAKLATLVASDETSRVRLIWMIA